MGLARAFLCASAVLFGTFAAAGPTIPKSQVNWQGEGKFRNKIDGPVRSAKCRVSGIPETAPISLRLKGKCAAPSGSASFDLALSLGGGSKPTGLLTTSVLKSDVHLNGTETSDGVALVSTKPLDVDGVPMTLQLDLKWSANGQLTMNEWLTPVDGGATVQIVWITLMK